jgi:integrase/recombinase XerD
MTNEITIIQHIGAMADKAAGMYEFEKFHRGLSASTLGNYHKTLEMFEDFLHHIGIPADDLENDPSAWSFCTYGLVVAFQKALQDHGYSASSINNRITAIKAHARYAHRAGYIGAETYTRMRGVEGIKPKLDSQGHHIHSGIPGAKKVEPNFLTDEQLETLKKCIWDTPAGRRNAAFMAVLCDMGLRIGEALGLCVENVDLAQGKMTFYRQKVKLVQTHLLTNSVLNTLTAYMTKDRPVTKGPLFVSTQGDKLSKRKLSRGQAFSIIREFGYSIGIDNLSAHDLRHSFTRRALNHGTSLEAIRDAGGWKNYNMVLLYAANAKIANQGVILD